MKPITLIRSDEDFNDYSCHKSLFPWLEIISLITNDNNDNSQWLPNIRNHWIHNQIIFIPESDILIPEYWSLKPGFLSLNQE